MATDSQMVDALVKAAESLSQRPLTQAERDDLLKKFSTATGTYRERAIKAIGGVTSLSEPQIRVKAAASNDTDRKIKDLENKLDEWKPGT